LENEVLIQDLPRGKRILDVGCGNGFSTAEFAKYAKDIIAIDYSSAMIERAKAEYGHVSNVRFEVRDILQLDFPSNSFDVAISQRCLINLPDWETQQKALMTIANVVKPGGYFFLQEGSKNGREKLNQVRESFGLSRMPAVSFNVDFDEKQLWPFIRRHFEIVKLKYFGLYDLVSRIVHPLLVSPEEPKYESKINEIASRISAKLHGADELSREFSACLRRLGS